MRPATRTLAWLGIAALALAAPALAGAPGSAASAASSEATESLACADARRLETLVTCITGHFGTFVVPSSTAQEEYSAAVQAMLDGTCDRSILRASLADAYDVRPFTDEDNQQRYCVLVEVGDTNQDGKVDRGWGTVITNPNARRDLSIAVPHPFDDSGTQDQGIGVFKGTDSRSFLLAGSRRELGGPSLCQASLGFEASDAAHNVAHPFFAATQALAAWHGSQEWTQVQFHGMSQQSCGSEVHLTSGIIAPPAPTDRLSTLKQNVRKYHPQWLVTVPGDTLPGGGAACSLNGTTDTEGRFLNGVPVVGCCTTPASSASGRFIHIEQDPNMRLASDWIQPVLDTWPPTLPPVRVTAPVNGATVAGTITLAAAVAHPAAVAGVQFFADGTVAGAEDTTAPYETTFDTTLLPNGSHSFAARARTAAGQTGTGEAVAVTVDNPSPPPGRLTLAAGISLVPTAPAVGDTVTASFAVQNTGGQPLAVDWFQVTAQGTGGEAADFPLEAVGSVLPQEQRTYQQSRSFLGAAPGTYTARPAASHVNQPVDITPAGGSTGTLQFTVVPCTFVLGFARLRELVPPFMGQPPIGDCLENEHHDPAAGESLQHTTAWHGLGGLLVWRALDNWTGFTDGYRTWVNGPLGIELRLNSERFCWELDATPGTCLPSGAPFIR